MTYLIKGPVPTVAVGDCPWCEKKNAVLHLMAMTFEGKLCGEYVCAKCLLALDTMREEQQSQRRALVNNPDVEVTGI